MYLLEAKARCADSVQNPEGTLEAGLSYTNWTKNIHFKPK
jgi:hypothetical protein